MVLSGAPLQAVVLAGGVGNRMTSVTDYNSKALMPLCNVPMFWYPLHVLAQNKFQKVLLIGNAENAEQIRQILDSDTLPELPGLSVEVVSPGSQEDDWGTADVLRHFANKITGDFVLMGGDFVSDINLRNMFEFHQARGSILTALLSNQACNSTAPGPKEMQKYRDFVVISKETGQLAYLQPEEDLEGNQIELDPHIFKNITNVELSANYADCHVYIIDKRILHVLEWERDLSSVKADLIPFLIEKQHSKDDLELLGLFEHAQLADHAFELRHGVDVAPPAGFRLFGYRSTRDAVSVIARCNTLGAYIEANRTVLDQNPPFLPDLKPQQYPGTKVHVIKSRVGSSTQVGTENLKIVKSSVGEGCVVGNGAKVEECIIMNNVRIGAGAKLTRCILSDGVEVGSECVLDNCVVEKDHNLPPKTQAKHEFIRTEVEMNIEDY